MSEQRLIDANALKEAIEEYRSLSCVCTSTIIGVRNVMYLIDNAPTISPEKALTDKLRGDENG